MNNLLILFIFLTETIAAQNVSVTISKKGKSAFQMKDRHVTHV